MADLTQLPHDLRQCSWWRPCTVAVLNAPTAGDRVQAELLPKLLAAFAEQGHAVLAHPTGAVNLMLAFHALPDDGAPLPQRIPERSLPLALTLMREYGLSKRPDNLVVLVTLRERLSPLPHMQVVEIARTAMARIGTPKIVFLSGDARTGRLDEATYCTLEGGHPTDTTDIVARVRDRLVAAACAREVGGDYRVVENAIPRSVWEATRTPEALIEAGHRMAALDLLPAPKRVSEYVSPDLARIYERYLGMKGFSEGMLFAFDPGTRTLMVTASGSWDVDKRALKRDEITPIGGMKDGKILVWAPEGIQTKGPSVEALEMYTLLQSVPTVRLSHKACPELEDPERSEQGSRRGSRRDAGQWLVDSAGDVVVPIIRAGVHVHVGVWRIAETWVENVPTNRRDFPYGFGCGTDLMKELAQDAARRSRAIMDPADPRAYVRWHMLYHGDTVVELWKPHSSLQPLQGLLDMFDPQRVGAIEYTPDHIEQL